MASDELAPEILRRFDRVDCIDDRTVTEAELHVGDGFHHEIGGEAGLETRRDASAQDRRLNRVDGEHGDV